MKQNRELENKRQTMNDLRKVVSLKMFNSIQKITEYEKSLKTILRSIYNINEVKKFLSKETTFFSIYSKKPSMKLKKSNLMIFIQSNDNTAVGLYSDKKIIEYISKKVSEKDSIWIIGARLYEAITKTNIISKKTKEKTILFYDYRNKKGGEAIDFGDVFQEIADYSLFLFENDEYSNISIYYSDIRNSGNVVSNNVLPLDIDNLLAKQKNIAVSFKYNDKHIDSVYNSFINSFKDDSHKINFKSNIQSINMALLELILTYTIKYSVVGFLLNIEIRKLHSLEEEDKNIVEKIGELNSKIKAFRQENITNEMLMIASSSIIKNRQELLRKKKEDEEIW